VSTWLGIRTLPAIVRIQVNVARLNEKFTPLGIASRALKQRFSSTAQSAMDRLGGLKIRCENHSYFDLLADSLWSRAVASLTM